MARRRVYGASESSRLVFPGGPWQFGWKHERTTERGWGTAAPLCGNDSAGGP